MPTIEVVENWRVLGFGKHPEIGAAVQACLREAGLAATIMVLTDDRDGDAQLVEELRGVEYDGVIIGSFISGQDPGLSRPLRRRSGSTGCSISSTPIHRVPGSFWCAILVTRCPRPTVYSADPWPR